MAQFNCDGCGCKVSDVDVQCPKCNAPIGKLQIVCKVCGCVLFERNATLLENNVFSKETENYSCPNSCNGEIQTVFQYPNNGRNKYDVNHSYLDEAKRLFIFLFVLMPLSSFFSISAQVIGMTGWDGITYDFYWKNLPNKADDFDKFDIISTYMHGFSDYEGNVNSMTECVDDVPDEKTVWKYRELLTNTGVYDKLFSEFHSFMESKGLQFNEGRIIDASFVIAPRQRNTRDENEQIKQGAGDKLWNDNPHKKCHKDVDARWTKKRDETFYGYKQHTKVEKRNKIILSYDTTSAEVHDSKGFEGLLDEKDEGKDLYLDAGYVGQEEIVKQHKMNPIICEKGYRNRPLTKEQKSDNRKKSKTRCLVEHVFGFEEQTMRGLVVRTVGLIRAKANVAFTSLVYNISRYTQIIRLKPELLG